MTDRSSRHLAARGRTARRTRPPVALLSATLLSVGCGGPPPGAPPASTGSGVVAGIGVCSATERARQVLRLGGGDLYVEPSVFLATEGGLLLAGAPLYEWRARADGSLVYEQDRILGVHVDGDELREIPRPDQVGPVAGLRVAALGPSRWGWLIEEVTVPDIRTQERVRVVYAEWDGRSWSTPEVVLTAPEAYEFGASSELVVSGAELRWLVPVAPSGSVRTVAEVTREAGAWRWSPLAGMRLDGGGAEGLRLASRPDGSLWAVVTGFSAPTDEARSVVVAALGQSRPTTRVQRAAPGELVQHRADLGSGPDGLTLAWRTGSPRGAWTAWGATAVRPGGEARPVRLEAPASQVSTVARPEGVPLWLVTEGALGAEGDLHIHRASGDRAQRVASMANPYTGFFAAVAPSASELVIVGPEASRDPARPAVRSLLLRLDIDCD